MKNLIFPGIVSFLFLLSIPIFAQHNNSELPSSIRADGAPPDASAILEVQDTTKGVLISRMDSLQRTSIINPATGLLVYQTDKQDGYYYFDGNKWILIHGELDARALLGYLPEPVFSCMSITGSLGIGTFPRSVAISDNYAYVIDENSDDLKVIDVSNPAAPSLTGSLGIGSWPYDLAVSGDYAYVVDLDTDDLKVIDVSDPSSPSLSGSLGVGSDPRSVAVSGDYAYVAVYGSDVLKVIDVSNPAAPSLSGSLGISDPTLVAVSGDYAYVIDAWNDHLKVIHVSNPAAPVLSGSRELCVAPTSIAVSGNYVYVVDNGCDNLIVVDVSNPPAPVLSGILGIGDDPRSVAVFGDYAYVVDAGSDDLKVIDVNNPATPVMNDSLGLGTAPWSIAVSGNYAYVVDFESDDLKVIDVGPCNPALGIDPLTGELIEGPPSLWEHNGHHISNVNTGNVGIGTNNPTYKFQVLGDVKIDEGGRLLLDRTSPTDEYAKIEANSLYWAGIQFKTTQTSPGNILTAMTIHSRTGHVGIGTHEPVNILDVGGGISIGSTYAGSSSAPSDGAIIEGNVGIGTATPSKKLHVFHTGGSGQIANEMDGGSVMRWSTTGVTPYIGCTNDYGFSLVTNNLYRLTALNTGEIGIGTTTPTHPFEMGSGAHVTSAGIWTNASDISKKYDIADISYGLDEIMQLEPSEYRYKADDSKSIGFIAQELEHIIPEAVSGEEGEKGIGYGLLTAVLVKAIQEIADQNENMAEIINKQHEMIEELKEQNEKIKCDLESRIEVLENSSNRSLRHNP